MTAPYEVIAFDGPDCDVVETEQLAASSDRRLENRSNLALPGQGRADTPEQGQLLDQPLLGRACSGVGFHQFARRELMFVTTMPKKHPPLSPLIPHDVTICIADGTPVDP